MADAAPTNAFVPTRSRSRWLMLALVWFLYFSFGLVSASLAPLLPDIQADLEISDALAGMALAGWQFVYVFFAIPAGAIIERLGPRRAMMVAGLLMAVSQLLRAAAFDFPSLLLAIALFGLGGPLVSIGAPATISRWFDARERPRATGLYSVAPAVGGVVALFSANTVFMPLTGDSWRLTLSLFAGVAILASALWVLFAREAPLAESTTGASSAMSRSMGKFRAVLSIPSVQLMLLMSIGIFMFGHGTSNWLPTLLHRQGLSKADAGELASLPTIFGVFGALAMTNFVSRGGGREFVALLVVFLLGGVSLFVVPQTHGAVQLVGLIMLGFGLNSATPLMMIILMNMQRVGPPNMGVAGGLWFTFGEIGGVLGPTVVGVMSSGVSLDAGFYLLGTVSLALLTTTFWLKRIVQSEQLVPQTVV